MDIINRPYRPNLEQRRAPAQQLQNIDNHINEEQMTSENLSQNRPLSNAGGMNLKGSETIGPDTSYSVDEAATSQHVAEGDASSYLYGSSSYDPSASPTGTIMNEYLQPPYGFGGISVIEFPSPSSLEYQSMHFLADLGLSGFSDNG